MRVGDLRGAPHAIHEHVDCRDQLRLRRLSGRRIRQLRTVLVRPQIGWSENTGVFEQRRLLIRSAGVRRVAQELHRHPVRRRIGHRQESIDLVDLLLGGAVERVDDHRHQLRGRERRVDIAPVAADHGPEPRVERRRVDKLAQAGGRRLAAVEPVPRRSQRTAKARRLIAELLRVDHVAAARRGAHLEIVLLGDRHRGPGKRR